MGCYRPFLRAFFDRGPSICDWESNVKVCAIRATARHNFPYPVTKRCAKSDEKNLWRERSALNSKSHLVVLAVIAILAIDSRQIGWSELLPAVFLASWQVWGYDSKPSTDRTLTNNSLTPNAKQFGEGVPVSVQSSSEAMAIVARIEKLERENAWLKRIGAVAGIVATALLFMGQGKQAGVPWQNQVLRIGTVQANRIEVLPEEPSGTKGSFTPVVRIIGATLTIFDEHGRARLHIDGDLGELLMGEF